MPLSHSVAASRSGSQLPAPSRATPAASRPEHGRSRITPTTPCLTAGPAPQSARWGAPRPFSTLNIALNTAGNHGSFTTGVPA